MISVKEILKKRKSYIQFLRNKSDNKKYTVFYGCGNFLDQIWDVWQECVLRKVHYVCDRDKNKWKKTFHGVTCISPDDLLSIADDCVVFITCGQVSAVYDFLKNRGIKNIYSLCDFNFDIKFEATPDYNSILLQDNLSKVKNMLSDERSHQVFDAVLSRVLAGNRENAIMQTVFDRNQYFVPEIMKLSDHESFVDVGAYTGDTIEDFINRTDGKFDNIYAFELCKKNFDTLTSNIASQPSSSKIICYNMGCWHKKEKITYDCAMSSSTVGTGDNWGIVDKLDNLLAASRAEQSRAEQSEQSVYLPVTLIKMDIEGAEMNALLGAEKIIRTQKPKLAICVYHDLRHLYEVPLYLKSLVPEYKIYFRHHSTGCYETVCYAVV